MTFLTKYQLYRWNFRKCFSRRFNQQLFSVNHMSTSSKYYRQPTPISHTHLLNSDEVTPGISVHLYRKRRTKIVETVCKNVVGRSENTNAHLIVVPSAVIQYMSEDIPYSFRQNSDFFYLCGFKEPNSVLVLHSMSEKSLPEHRCVLFIPKQTAHSVKWEGAKMDLSAVTDFLGIDEAFYMDDLEKYLLAFTKSQKRFTVWYDYLTSTPFRQIHQTMSNFIAEYSGSLTIESPRSVFHQVRVIKSDAEAELMMKTCKIAAESMKEVIRFSQPMIPESHLQAKMDYECRIRGADCLAFPPVVAGGDRANTIHYIHNNHIIEDSQLVLMDSGCECHGYNSDLTRTWPVNGKFTDPQRELYEVLLSVQEEIILMCKTKQSLDHLYKIMLEILGKGLQELGIIRKYASKEQIIETTCELCPHHVSHYLGIDVHDTNLISRSIELQAGMVVTVEPGVYISKTNSTVPEKYRGLGMRIEDDILITKEGFEILTSDCPKKIDQIEKLFNNIKD